jgi:glycosyltransferase involved in cell wall biosynthesis
MNVCHVITRLILGGAQENTLLTCEGLLGRGHEVTLVTGPPLGPEGELMERALAGGYRVEVIDAMRREINAVRDAKTYRQLGRLLREIDPDVMHSHSSKAGILARRAAARAGGMKIVHTIHGLPFHRYEAWWRNRLYIALERRAARRTDAIISVADAMTRQALAAGVGTPEQYVTIRSGMETQRFLQRPAEAETFRASLGLPEDAVLFTQVSRIAELKGHGDILRADALLDDPRVHFCFVGDGALRRRVEQRIAESGRADRFHLTGLLSPDRIPAVMHASDVLIHASYREGLARTLPQAMLAGTPVISYDVDGAPEVVSGRTGVLVPPGDVGALAGAIGELAGDRERRERLGRSGRELAGGLFDQEQMVDAIERLYRSLLEE